MSSAHTNGGERQSPRDPGCLERHDPRKYPEEFLSLLAIILIVIGTFIAGVGFLVSRETEFDPSSPAREMEELENYYALRGYRLDLCIAVGIGFISVGGLIMAGILMKGICLGEYNDMFDAHDQSSVPGNGSKKRQENKHYGSSDNTDRTVLTRADYADRLGQQSPEEIELSLRQPATQSTT